MKQKKLILVKLIGIGNDESKRINNDDSDNDDTDNDDTDYIHPPRGVSVGEAGAGHNESINADYIKYYI